MKRIITDVLIDEFKMYLYENEKSKNTIEKYIRDIRKIAIYLQKRSVCKEKIIEYKAGLLNEYTVASANSIIAAINSFMKFVKWDDCCVKQYKLQRTIYYPEEKELTKEEYYRLIRTAQKTDERLSLIIQTICGTGIRVSELQYITVEAVRKGEAVVNCKGKTRIILITDNLKKRLLEYTRNHKITTGLIFITRGGKPVSRCNIWRDMKALCEKAGVSPKKVFPHNLRHLFARTFYGIEKDIVKLADILGHSSINTTRIYVLTTCCEHKKRMENLRLII